MICIVSLFSSSLFFNLKYISYFDTICLAF
nr:MAG TPA: hypothetical protein [Caudoviricetes sp.]